MTTVKDALKRTLPPRLRLAGSDAYWWWFNRGRHRASALASPAWGRSRSSLRAVRNAHRGERCFILGNGPSLRQTNLGRLEDEVTFGLNRVYLLFPELGFTTSYYVAVNTLVIEQCAADIRSLHIPKFITWRARQWLQGDPQTVFLDTDYTGPETFSGDVTGRVFEGSTVTYVALQLAFHMGFETVILVGVDHNFSTQGTPNATVVSKGDDPDHFSAGYFGRGFRWQLPDLEGSERAYRLADEAYRSCGRRVVDATLGGKLTVFPKVDFESLF